MRALAEFVRKLSFYGKFYLDVFLAKVSLMFVDLRAKAILD